MTFVRAVLTLLRLSGFRRLVISRVTSQGSDGLFQVALASHVLFNPQHATDAREVAAAFAVVLLPYSVLGPFVGVLLDRWPRRRVLVVSQLLRAVAILAVAALVTDASTGPAFFVAVLVVFSVNRFVLAGFSAAMPHVVTRDRLVEANSVAPTLGSLAYLLGGGVGGALRAAGNDLVIVLAASGGVLLAAWAAARLPYIGPDDDEPGPTASQVLGSIAAGFIEAARTLPRRGRLLLGLIFLTRLPFGFVLLQTLLLFRGPFAGSPDPTGGLLRFGLAAAASAAGFALAAFVTPWLAARWGSIPYAAHCLALAGAATLVLGPWLTPWTIAAVGFVIAFASQAVKINVDSLMQADVPDELLGRTFAAYDVAYNTGLVLAAAIAAWTLPASGLAAWPFVVLAGGYALVVLALEPRWHRAERLDEVSPLG